jgi:protein-glutamine gamma-glutamyltransferase
MVRTALVSAGVAALVAWSWGRLESPRAGLGALVAVAAVAVLPALVARRRLRIAAAIAAAAVAVWIALGVSPFDVNPFNGEDDYASPLLAGVRNGILDFYDVTLPFDGVAHPDMHGVLLLAVFGFCLLAALAVAARRPVAAALVLLIGAGWPATILPGDDELVRGAVLLAAVLALLAALAVRPGRVQTQVLAGGAVVLLALTLSVSSAVARGQFVAWENWDLYTEPDESVQVSYVWRANYDGVRFPNKRTRVLRVRAPGRAGYWRATTLDAFVGHVWDEDLRPISGVAADRRNLLFDDELLPEAALDEDSWARADVIVDGLADNHLVGISQPVAYETGELGPIDYASGGVATVSGLLERGDEYTMWGFAPRPKPSALDRSAPEYPSEIADDRHYLSVEGLGLPPFGTPQRLARMRELFERDGAFQPYAPVFDEAQRLAGRARSPYAATVALEAWFRSGGGFEYDETPPRRPLGAPPLVYFLTESKAGYCQHFAGAMALMLRFLGVPARVAAGFTSGTYDRERRVWNVSDRNAHTWVEVWFRGFGWLPFDPTPGRGNLGGPYSASSFSFDAPGVEAVLRGSGLAATTLLGERDRNSQTEDLTPRDVRRAAEEGEGGSSFGLAQIVLLALLALATLLAVGKLVRRRRRYLTKDPRRLATAYRQELVEFLADQRIDVPPSATLTELRALVQAETGVETRRLVESLGLARFGPLAAAPRAARIARAELRAVKRRLRRALSAGHRMRGTFSLRSLVVR